MKKGFTLIELLAVIVILAIIAVIAVPIILNIIEDTKINSVKTSANLYLKAAELYISNAELNKVKIEPGTYPITKEGNVCIGIIEEDKCTGKVIKIQMKGNKPSGGEIIVNEKGNIKISQLKINDYIYYRDNNEYLVEKASKHTIMSNNSLITFDSSKLGTLSNYKIYGNTKKIEGPKNIADPKQVENFVAGMQALGTTNYGNYTNIIIDDNDRDILSIFSASGYGHENYDELRKIFKGIFKENTQYTISFDYYKNTTSEGVNMRIIYTDGVQEVLTNFKISPGEAEKGTVYSFEHTTLANKTISSIDLRNGSGSTYIYLDTLQIEEGISQTKYTPYGKKDYLGVGNLVRDKNNENYGKYEIPIKLIGKNLFNENDLLEVSSVTKVENGYSVSDYPAQYSRAYKLQQNIKSILKSGISYTLSRKVSNYVKASSGSINFRDSDSAFVSTAPYEGIKFSTFDLSDLQISNFSSVWIYGLGDNPTIYEYIQLEVGKEATEYEPYKEENYSIYLDEPLRCFDDICDYIDYQRGMVVRHIEQIDDSGDKSFEESFKISEKTKYEKVSLPKLNTNEGITNIFINTYIKPSNVVVSST